MGPVQLIQNVAHDAIVGRDKIHPLRIIGFGFDQLLIERGASLEFRRRKVEASHRLLKHSPVRVGRGKVRFQCEIGRLIRGQRLLRIARDKQLLNFGRLAIERRGRVGRARRLFRPQQLADAEQRLSFLAKKLEVVRVFAQRGLTSRQTGLIFPLRLRILLAVLIDVADFHMRDDDVIVARIVVAQRRDFRRDRDRRVVFF